MSNPVIHTELLGKNHMIILGIQVVTRMKRRSVRVVPTLTPGVIEIFCNSLARFKTREILIDFSKQLNHEFGKVYDLKKYEKLMRLKHKCELELYTTLRLRASTMGLGILVGSIRATIVSLKDLNVVSEVNFLKEFISGSDDSESLHPDVLIRRKCDRNELARDLYNTDHSGGIYLGLIYSQRRRSFAKRNLSRVRMFWNDMFRRNKFEFV